VGGSVFLRITGHLQVGSVFSAIMKGRVGSTAKAPGLPASSSHTASLGALPFTLETVHCQFCISRRFGELGKRPSFTPSFLSFVFLTLAFFSGCFFKDAFV
jgi:hypothetical protein